MCVIVSEGWHGGRPRLPLSTPKCWHDDPEVDAQSAHEQLCWRLGIWTQVQNDHFAEGFWLRWLCQLTKVVFGNLSNLAPVCGTLGCCWIIIDNNCVWLGMQLIGFNFSTQSAACRLVYWLRRCKTSFKLANHVMYLCQLLGCSHPKNWKLH